MNQTYSVRLVVKLAVGVCALISGAIGSTLCLQDREYAKSLLRMDHKDVFVPECEPDGTWKDLQCNQNTGFCHCRLPDGKLVKGSLSRKLEYCKCLVERQQVLDERVPRLLRSSVPQCEANGLYKVVQCRGRYCHCCNPVNGVKTSEPVPYQRKGSLRCLILED